VFKQHSIVHDFTALKWAFPLSIVSFGVFPIVFLGLARDYRVSRAVVRIAVFCIIALFTGTIFRTLFSYKDFFGEGTNFNRDIGELVRRNSDYYDICFAFGFGIPDFPPQRLAYSKKRVYKIRDILQIKDMLSRFSERQAKGKLFIQEKEWADLRYRLTSVCSDIYRDSDYYICEIADIGRL
jgi:hypothetical protein